MGLEMLDGGRSCDDRCALFPGVTAYPADTRATRRGHDQLHLIIDMLGTPTRMKLRILRRKLHGSTFAVYLCVRRGSFRVAIRGLRTKSWTFCGGWYASIQTR